MRHTESSGPDFKFAICIEVDGKGFCSISGTLDTFIAFQFLLVIVNLKHESLRNSLLPEIKEDRYNRIPLEYKFTGA